MPDRPEDSSRVKATTLGFRSAQGTRLPLQLTSFVGRERELPELAHLVGTARLMTLTGAGGIGKTRLAVEVGQRLAEQFSDGVWLVDLASVADARLVPQAVASVLGISEQARQPLMDVLTDGLRSRALLLVLDNCEHLVDSCGELAQRLLQHCPELRILATSREPLGVAGETTWRVPPLGLPERRADLPSAMVAQSEAARLFAQRASAALPGFSLAQHAATVARICWQVDGIPLALELAAVWVRVLSVEQIAERLSDAPRLLSTGSRLAPARQRTLRATFEWSYSLLSEPERVLLARVSVFIGGWTLEACEEVCGDDRRTASHTMDNLNRERVLELLGGLIDKSLVFAEPAADGMRYRMLEPLRQFALERLVEQDAASTMRRRHATWFVAVATDAARQYHRPGEIAALERLEREHANLQAAFENLVELGDDDAAARLALALWWFWINRDHWQEARTSPERLLDKAELNIGASRHAEVLSLAAVTAWLQGDFPRANRWVAKGLAVARQQVEPGPLAAVLAVAGQFALSQAEYATSRQLFDEGLPLARAAGDYWNETRMLDGLARLALVRDDPADAARLLDACATFAREVGDDWTLATVSNTLGDVARSQGDYPRAKSLYDESLTLFGILQNDGQRPSLLHNLGYVALHERDYARSRELFGESLGLFQRFGERRGVAECLVGFASIAAAAGRPDRAARLFGAAEAAFEALGTQLSASNRADYARHRAIARASMRPAAFTAAWTSGQQLRLEQAVDEALQVTESGDSQPHANTGKRVERASGRRARVQREANPLTARERQVAELVTRGVTNRQIGEALVITEGTAALHVKNALAKLGFTSRAQLASWATARGELSIS
jgi:predicted ATPase/DNA-binding CsgD family transcriptional regulator